MAEWKKRVAFIAFAIPTLVLGLGSRRYAEHLPDFIAAHAGDALWAVLVYCGVGFLFPSAKLATRAAMTLGFAFVIECSQLYHPAWLDAVRATTLGGLVLGYQFVWVDLVRYTLGVVLAVLGEQICRSLNRSTPIRISK